MVKSRIRWLFAVGSALVVVLGLFDLQRNPWTQPTPITDAELNEAKAAATKAAAEASAVAAGEEPDEEADEELTAGEASAAKPNDDPAPAGSAPSSQ